MLPQNKTKTLIQKIDGYQINVKNRVVTGQDDQGWEIRQDGHLTIITKGNQRYGMSSTMQAGAGSANVVDHLKPEVYVLDQYTIFDKNQFDYTYKARSGDVFLEIPFAEVVAFDHGILTTLDKLPADIQETLVYGFIEALTAFNQYRELAR